MAGNGGGAMRDMSMSELMRARYAAEVRAVGGRVLTAEQWAAVGRFVRYFEDYDAAVDSLGRERTVILAALDDDR